MIADELAAWGTAPVDVPGEVRAAAARHLLDGVGTAIGGLRAGTVAAAVEVARGLGGPPEATLFGTTERIGAPAAALATGALVHALDFDDTHAGGLVHATAVVLPAAFAVGEQVGATGREVLDAAVVGYETVCRVAAAAPHGFHARGLHATMVAGVFSSALVAARLLGLDAARAVDALGIAGSQSGGLLAFLHTGASTKQLHPGFASHAGILAARLAAAGASGPANVFDGPDGLYDALATGAGRPRLDRRGARPALGDHPDRHQALPGLPALARRAGRGPRRAAPGRLRRRRRRGDRGRRAPGLGADRLRRTARPGPARLAVRRQVLPAVERRRDGPRRRRDHRHLRARVHRPAGGGGARPAGAVDGDRGRAAWPPTPPAPPGCRLWTAAR